MFAAFEDELKNHQDGKYHRLSGPLQRRDVEGWFHERALKPSPAYVDFLCTIGPGSFFSGALTIYPLSSDRRRSVESEIERLRQVSTEPIIPFGYDGTTESCFCFNAMSGNDEVYWFSWEKNIKRSLSMSFGEWIESQPKELFNEKIYAGHKRLANIDALVDLMDERAAFTVRLVGFDKQLQRPLDKPNDMLPRYHKLTLEVLKARVVTIQVLTIVVLRTGSKVGEANIAHLTFPVHDMPVGLPTTRECYIFDPFNVPFTEIKVKFNPVIDLGSSTRTQFKEIVDFL